MNKVTTIFIAISALLSGCATGTKSNGKIVLDSSRQRNDWVDKPQLVWDMDGKMYSKATHTIRGDQQLSACYSLAKLDSKENLLSEISTEIKGAIDNASMDISENAETVLGKVRSGKFEGTVYGQRFNEEYFERYMINGVERVDCSVLSEISKSDYDKTKRSVIDKVIAADARVKEAIIKKQVDFFSDRQPSSQPVVNSEDKE